MDEFGEKRRQWDAIHEREQIRMVSLSELRKFIDSLGEGKRNAKSLLKLVVFTGGIRESDAADLLGVPRDLIEKWVRFLMEKGLADIESTHHPNPTIKPTKKVLISLTRYSREKLAEAASSAEREEEPAPDEVKGAADGQAAAIAPPTESGGGEDVRLDAGVTYIVIESESGLSVRLFLRQIRNGLKGLYVARTNPMQIKKRYYMGDARIVWLTSMQPDSQIESISGLQDLSILISNFVDGNDKSVILFEGLEYLISNNSFPVVLRMVQQIRDKVSTCESNIIMPVNPDTLEERQMTLLTRECQIIRADG